MQKAVRDWGKGWEGSQLPSTAAVPCSLHRSEQIYSLLGDPHVSSHSPWHLLSIMGCGG